VSKELASIAAREVVAMRYSREPANGGRVAALESLHSKLVECSKDFSENNIGTKQDAIGRALLSVTNYLVDQGFKQATLLPLLHVEQAITEIQRGRSDPLFKPNRSESGGTPPRSHKRLESDGMIAYMAELWIEDCKGDGRIQNVVLRECAKKLKGPYFGTLTAVQLKKAREAARGESKDHPTRVHYEWCKARDAGKRVRRPDFGPRQAFEQLLIFLNETLNPAMGEQENPKTPSVFGED
jgi:hypothetical protein